MSGRSWSDRIGNVAEEIFACSGGFATGGRAGPALIALESLNHMLRSVNLEEGFPFRV